MLYWKKFSFYYAFIFASIICFFSFAFSFTLFSKEYFLSVFKWKWETMQSFFSNHQFFILIISSTIFWMYLNWSKSNTEKDGIILERKLTRMCTSACKFRYFFLFYSLLYLHFYLFLLANEQVFIANIVNNSKNVYYRCSR